MFALYAKIEIKSRRTWSFSSVSAVEITRDAETLTDTCVLTLPRKVGWRNEVTVPVGRGDEVSVWLGYDETPQLAFRGFITAVGLKSPLTITCEDYMFKFKMQAALKKAYRSATIGTVLQDQGLGIDCLVFGEQRLGAFRVTASTVSGLFGQLKDHGGVRSFIRVENGRPLLYAGVLFDRGTRPTQVFSTGRNIIDDTQLKEQSADDLKIKVKAISLQPDNSKIEAEEGDADGEIRTLYTYNKDQTALKAWAVQELKRLKGDGLTGSFTTFGAQLADKLDNIGIKIGGERKGVYQVRKNVIKFGIDGFRQEITLGAKVAQ